MRIAVISDIHGNCIALDAAMAEIQTSSIDRIICLGDTIQGGPQPKETIGRLRSIGCTIVMGNADHWLLDEESDPNESATNEQLEVRDWTLSNLSSSDLDYLRSFQPLVKIVLEDNTSMVCFHGSPVSYDDVLLPGTPKEVWDRLLGPYSPAIMTGGHTHTQQLRRVQEGLFFNPGSIGFACNHLLPAESAKLDPWAEYAVLTHDQGRLQVEFRRVPFDEKRLVSIINTSGRPEACHYMNEYKNGFRVP